MRYGYGRMMYGYGNGGHMQQDAGGWGWGAYLAMGLGMLILVGLVAWVIFLLTRDHEPSDAPPEPESPEDILARRLAEGGIAPDEYRERVAVLRGGDPSAGDR